MAVADARGTHSKVALVTGAARRVGAAIARALHARGLAVAVHYRDSATDATSLIDTLNARRTGSALAIHADLGRADQARRLVDEAAAWLGGLDVLVNNASSFFPTPIEAVTEEQFDDLIGSNLKGPVFVSAAAAAHLRARSGAIVNITDIHARYPLHDHPVYCAAKAGLESLTRSLARDLAPQVRVNGVAPGAILWPERGMSADERAAILASTELERIGAPDDIAGAVVYFALDAPYVTGQILSVDGGRTLGP